MRDERHSKCIRKKLKTFKTSSITKIYISVVAILVCYIIVRGCCVLNTKMYDPIDGFSARSIETL
jgi:hypothetical protein